MALELAASASAGQWSASMTPGGGASTRWTPLEEEAGCFQADLLAGAGELFWCWSLCADGSGDPGAGSMVRGCWGSGAGAAAAGGGDPRERDGGMERERLGLPPSLSLTY